MSKRPTPVLLLRDDPLYHKYFKMLECGIDRTAVAIKMNVDGINPNVLDMDLDQPTYDCDAKERKIQPFTGLAKDHPSYKIYFEMLKVGVPKDGIKNSIKLHGLDENVIDLDPEEPFRDPSSPEN
mmetsp:Transcript_2762/g.4136  ORF Transcript_2762/g.4136 Transcript_2762/m.4136 type:complete len:125 (+) Transcript_2762:58-432(+)